MKPLLAPPYLQESTEWLNFRNRMWNMQCLRLSVPSMSTMKIHREHPTPWGRLGKASWGSECGMTNSNFGIRCEAGRSGQELGRQGGCGQGRPRVLLLELTLGALEAAAEPRHAESAHVERLLRRPMQYDLCSWSHSEGASTCTEALCFAPSKCLPAAPGEWRWSPHLVPYQSPGQISAGSLTVTFLNSEFHPA